MFHLRFQQIQRRHISIENNLPVNEAAPKIPFSVAVIFMSQSHTGNTKLIDTVSKNDVAKTMPLTTIKYKLNLPNSKNNKN